MKSCHVIQRRQLFCESKNLMMQHNAKWEITGARIHAGKYDSM